MTSKWPCDAASMVVPVFQGQLLVLSHCNTSKWPPEAAAQVSSLHSSNALLATAHSNTRLVCVTSNVLFCICNSLGKIIRQGFAGKIWMKPTMGVVFYDKLLNNTCSKRVWLIQWTEIHLLCSWNLSLGHEASGCGRGGCCWTFGSMATS